AESEAHNLTSLVALSHASAPRDEQGHRLQGDERAQAHPGGDERAQAHRGCPRGLDQLPRFHPV
ncbi:hypothetical protein T484DRAFT_1886179, partial [Baffinella frigidus]